MLVVVIERFKGRDPARIYQRLRESGRHMPDGLKYIDSWIEANFDRGFQLMETDDPRLLQDDHMGHSMQVLVGKPNLGTSMVLFHCLDALGFLELEPCVRINMLVRIVLQGHRSTEYQV